MHCLSAALLLLLSYCSASGGHFSPPRTTSELKRNVTVLLRTKYEIDVRLSSEKVGSALPFEQVKRITQGALAGVDYPNYAELPVTSFQCREAFGVLAEGGLYADRETQCQAYHFCTPLGTKTSFLCPNGTVFDQRLLSCNWWFEVDCEPSVALYQKPSNERLMRDLSLDQLFKSVANTFGAQGSLIVDVPPELPKTENTAATTITTPSTLTKALTSKTTTTKTAKTQPETTTTTTSPMTTTRQDDGSFFNLSIAIEAPATKKRSSEKKASPVTRKIAGRRNYADANYADDDVAPLTSSERQHGSVPGELQPLSQSLTKWLYTKLSRFSVNERPGIRWV